MMSCLVSLQSKQSRMGMFSSPTRDAIDLILVASLSLQAPSSWSCCWWVMTSMPCKMRLFCCVCASHQRAGKWVAMMLLQWCRGVGWWAGSIGHAVSTGAGPLLAVPRMARWKKCRRVWQLLVRPLVSIIGKISIRNWQGVMLSHCTNHRPAIECGTGTMHQVLRASVPASLAAYGPICCNVSSQGNHNCWYCWDCICIHNQIEDQV